MYNYVTIILQLCSACICFVIPWYNIMLAENQLIIIQLIIIQQT